MQSLLTDLIDSILAMPEAFTEVAMHDPLSAVLMAVGSVLFLATFGVFGYLALGAAVDAVVPDVSAGGPPQAGR